LVRLRKTLIHQRTAWQQRIHAQLFHQGVPGGLRLRTQAGREALRRAELSPAGRELVALGLRMFDAFDRELAPLDREAARVCPPPARLPRARRAAVRKSSAASETSCSPSASTGSSTPLPPES
jgi:hypothetical protein